MNTLCSKAETRRRTALALGGALIGAALFLLLYGTASIRVTNDAWITSGMTDHDIMQHYAGWLFYRDAPLRFPLGSAVAMQYPSGVGGTLTFTDSVPLAGIFFRFFAGILPQTFQYFGLWSLGSYMAMGAAAALLLALFLKRNACVLLGASVFVLSPAMADRVFRHTGLISHFLIVSALYLYFKNKKEGHRYRAGWVVLAVLAMTIHPYFLPMVFALLFADLLEHCVQEKQARTWGQSVLFLLGCIAAALAAGVCIGAFTAPSSADNTYGFWTMNLNALFNPRSVGAVWSRVLPVCSLTNGNIDGFNYLGLGVLLFGAVGLLLWCCTAAKAQLKPLLRRHFGLIFVCACLSVFAVSHVVTVFGRTLFTLPLPEKLVQLCSIFRASGRMFWVVNYLLVLCVVVFWGRRSAALSAAVQGRATAGTAPACAGMQAGNGAHGASAAVPEEHATAPRAAAARFLRGSLVGTLCLAALLAVQLWDLSPGFAAKRTIAQAVEPLAETPAHGAVWDALAGQYAHVFSFDNPLQLPYDLALWAAKSGMTTNDVFTARRDSVAHGAEVQAELERLKAAEYDVDTLYFTCSYERFQALAEALRAADADVTCAKLDDLWYVIIPNKPGVTLPPESDGFVLYPHFPLYMADYTDALWTSGVLNSDPRILLLYDDAVTRAVLDNATALVAEGKPYAILKADNSDAGWIMLTLDIKDASVLAGMVLTAA